MNMKNNRIQHFITRNHENDAYYNLAEKIAGNNKFFITPEDTLFLNVSPDYSSIVTQRLRHEFSSPQGEIIDTRDIEVPYPDETDNTYYIEKIQNLVEELFANKWYKNFVFIEAGVIRGSNYKMIEEIFLQHFNKKQLLFTSLFQNKESKFKCDCIGELYDDTIEDLTFYWERYNKHWK